ncbi:MAG: LysM peptidoglycan-binding domain-containing protein [Luteimonas sp.]|jgi:nucleoid-associated protein YgaU
MTRSAPPDARPLRTYLVRKGDTLSGIAESELGAQDRWRELFDANRDVLDDPDALHAGQVLQLPAA